MNEILSIPFAEYLKRPGISQSMLKCMIRSPAHFKHAIETREAPTRDKIVGHIFHTAVLEPDLLAQAYYLRPATYPGKKKALKWSGNADWCKDWLEAHKDREVITATEQEMILAMRKTVMEHPSARRALERGKTEYALFCTDPESGVGLKCRPDRLSGNTIPDLKSTVDASPAGFGKQVVNLHYDVQAAFYLDIANWLGLEKEYFIWIACEKEPPYAVGVYYLHLHDPAILIGRAKYRRWLNTAALCFEQNDWPAYDAASLPLQLPSWYLSQGGDLLLTA